MRTKTHWKSGNIVHWKSVGGGTLQIRTVPYWGGMPASGAHPGTKGRAGAREGGKGA